MPNNIIEPITICLLVFSPLIIFYIYDFVLYKYNINRFTYKISNSGNPDERPTYFDCIITSKKLGTSFSVKCKWYFSNYYEVIEGDSKFFDALNKKEWEDICGHISRKFDKYIKEHHKFEEKLKKINREKLRKQLDIDKM